MSDKQLLKKTKQTAPNKQAQVSCKKGLILLALILSFSWILAACNTSQAETTAPAASQETEAETDTNEAAETKTEGPTEDETNPEADDPEDDELPHLNLVTSFLPMYIFTANIIEGVPGITLENMAAPDTGCLHDYRLMPADMVLLEDSNVFIINGAEMEGFMGDIAGRMNHLTIIDASLGIEVLIDEYGYFDHDHDDDHDHDEDHDDDHDHDEDHDHDDHDEDHDDEHDHHGNPHVWLSIPLAIQQIENITEGLKAIDPQHAAIYTQNSDNYIARLQALYVEMFEALELVDRREIITFHEAFPYFADTFNLEIVGVINREPGSEPTASEIAKTIDLVREKGIKAVFAEPQYPLRIAEMIAAETGIQVYILDPISSGEPSADFYEIKMRENMEVLVKALTDSE